MSLVVLIWAIGTAIRRTLSKAAKKEAVGDQKCPQCYKVFPSEKQLAHHVDYYHARDGVVHECGICEKTFNTKNSRSVHQYQKHSKEEIRQSKEKQAPIIKDEKMSVEDDTIEEIDYNL